MPRNQDGRDDPTGEPGGGRGITPPKDRPPRGSDPTPPPSPPNRPRTPSTDPPPPGGGNTNRPDRPTNDPPRKNRPDKPTNDPPLTDPLPAPAPPKKDPLTPRPPRQKPPTRTDVFKRQKSPLRAFYGRRLLRGAHRAYDRVQSDGRRVVCYWWSWGQINALSNFVTDGRTFAQLGLANGVDYNVYLGGGSSAADAIMAQYVPQWATIPHRTDIAQVIVKYHRPSTRWPMVNVEAVECIGEGLLVRDPRTDPTLATRYYRSNAMLAIADAETDTRFGGCFPVDAEDWDSIAEAADDCDFDLGGGRKRYGPIGWELDEPIPDWDAFIDDVRGMAALNVSYNGGKRYWWVDKLRPPTGLVFTDQGAGANIVSVSAMVVKGAADIPDRVVVNITNEAGGWKKDSVADPEVMPAGADGVEWSFDYYGILGTDHGKRVARMIRKRAMVDKSAAIRTLADGLQVVPGSRVNVASATQLNWSGLDVMVGDCAPVEGRSAWELTVAPFVDIYDDTEAIVTTFIPPANPSPYDNPPEVVNLRPGGGGLIWDEPQVRSGDLYGSTFWTATNLSLYDASKVNNGDIVDTCFNWNNAGASNVRFDAGAGNVKKFLECSYSYTAMVAGPKVEYSDDAVSWFPVVSVVTMTGVSVSGAVTTITTYWEDAGSHRYWRFAKGSATPEASTFTEVQFREHLGPYLFAQGYKVYDLRTGTPELKAYYPANQVPTALVPLSLAQFEVVQEPTFDAGGSVSWDLLVTVVAATDPEIESPGVIYSISAIGAGANQRSEYVRQAEYALVLVNGLNSDVVIPAGPALAVITGPTGAFSVGGWDASSYTGGEEFSVYYDGVQAGTVARENGFSVATNRIKTYSGASITLNGPFEAHFKRVNAIGRWVFQWGRDSTGLK